MEGTIKEFRLHPKDRRKSLNDIKINCKINCFQFRKVVLATRK